MSGRPCHRRDTPSAMFSWTSVRRLEAIRGYDEAYLSIRTPDVLARIEKGDPSWQRLVPPAVADVIKAKKLFGWAEAAGPACRVQSRSAAEAG